jgi:ribosomal protein S27AE
MANLFNVDSPFDLIDDDDWESKLDIFKITNSEVINQINVKDDDEDIPKNLKITLTGEMVEQIIKVKEPMSIEDQKIIFDYKECESCGAELNSKSEERLTCYACGAEKVLFGNGSQTSMTIINSHSISGTSSAPIVPSGTGAHKYQKTCHIAGSDYTITKKRIAQSQIYKYNFEADEKHQLPENVIKDAIELVCRVQNIETHRKGVRKGIQAACVWFACVKWHVTRKPSEIANMFRILQSDLSKGDDTLRQYHADGLIELPLSRGIAEIDFIFRYMKILNIPMEYEGFLVRMVKRAGNVRIKQKLGIKSIGSTKCAGAINLLRIKKDLPITENDIAIKCSICKSTFNKFTQAILANESSKKFYFDKIYASFDILKETERKKQIKTKKIVSISEHLTSTQTTIGDL